MDVVTYIPVTGTPLGTAWRSTLNMCRALKSHALSVRLTHFGLISRTPATHRIPHAEKTSRLFNAWMQGRSIRRSIVPLQSSDAGLRALGWSKKIVTSTPPPPSTTFLAVEIVTVSCIGCWWKSHACLSSKLESPACVIDILESVSSSCIHTRGHLSVTTSQYIPVEKSLLINVSECKKFSYKGRRLWVTLKHKSFIFSVINQWV